MKTEFLILADHGNLKIFLHDKRSSPTLRLIEARTLEEGQGRYADKLADQAGSFPRGDSGGNADSTAERLNAEKESQARCVRHISAIIMDFWKRHHPMQWTLAAPAEMHASILESLSEECLRDLNTVIPKDLVNAPASNILCQLEKSTSGRILTGV